MPPPAPSELNVPVLPTATATPDGAADVTGDVTADVTVAEPVGELVTVAAEPTEECVAHYQGPNSYRATPRFEVAYDTSVWEYVEDDGSGRQSQLKHRSDPGCTIWLRAGAVGTTEVATVWLAERAWMIGQVQSHFILYWAPEGDIGWIFGVLLPEEYSGMGNSNCQDAAERVIDTFTIVE
ncbi:MAG: hypothetical protein U0X20_23150 [Caldilineaceae bacterium]